VDPGERVAERFVLKRVIGRGRSGEVWLARDELVRGFPDVVLKPVQVTGDHDSAAARLSREAEALGRLRSHPHVVTLYHVELRTDPMWMVMEHLPKGSLDRRLSEGPVAPREAARIGAQIADVLVALHARNLVHCDIKPQNIGVTEHGDAKLIDFGSAFPFPAGDPADTLDDDEDGDREGERPRVMLTLDYAAPELARGYPRPASDVFCLGSTLYALVTGCPPRPWTHDEYGESSGDDGGPLPGSAHWGRRRKIREGVVATPRDTGPLREVLGAMLEADPHDRPTATQAREVLRAVADPPDPPRRTGWRRRAAVTTAVTSALAVGAALGGWILDEPNDQGGGIGGGGGTGNDPQTHQVATAAELSRALDAVMPGDTIELAPGWYHGTFFSTAQGTAEQPITLTGPEGAVLSSPGMESCSPSQRTDVTYCGYGIHLNHAAHWNLTGFSVADSAKGIVLDDSDHVTIDGVSVYAIQEEAVHFRTSSSDNVIRDSRISYTGLGKPEYGEAIVFGSATSNWAKYGEGVRVGGLAPDRSDRNQARNNTIGPNVTAEHVDVHEGTRDGVISGNSFDGHGISGANYADSLVDIKGDGYVIEGNSGTFGGDGVLRDGFQAHAVEDGWGCGNTFRSNTADLGGADGYGFYIPDQTTCGDDPAGPNKVLPDNSAAGADSGLSNIQTTDTTA
jgi:hypothetical protein